ncbi:MAG: DUF2500 family protein [Clostridiales bacterium]|nr:DUF2500 family protein [Clostridiales bacterium]
MLLTANDGLQTLWILSIVLFALVFIISIAAVLKSLRHHKAQLDMPLETDTAILEKKRTRYTRDIVETDTSSHYLYFTVINSQRQLRCNVDSRIYRQMKEGMTVRLTRQGTLCTKIEFNGYVREADRMGKFK